MFNNCILYYSIIVYGYNGVVQCRLASYYYYSNIVYATMM